MKKRDLVKAGAGMVTAAGVGMLLSNMLKSVMPTDAKLPAKLCMGFAISVLAFEGGEIVGKYAGTSIDTVMEAVDLMQSIRNGTLFTDEDDVPGSGNVE